MPILPLIHRDSKFICHILHTDDICYRIFVKPHVIDVRNITLFIRFEFSTICRYTHWVVRITNVRNIFWVTERGICGVTVQQNQFSHVHRLRE
jgi:hypothetical protein